MASITIDNIPKLPIKDLIDDTIMQSAILALIDFRDLISVNPNFTYTKVMKKLVIQALEKFEKVCPLFKRSKCYFQGNDYEFVDNFKAFIDGTVTEEFANLLPRSVYNIDTSLLHTRRSWRYDRPIMRGTYNMGLVYVDYLASYPWVMEENEEKNDFTDDSCIYYIPLYGGNSQDAAFKKQFYYEVLTYMKAIKNNLRYPDMPIELMQGIDEEYQIIQQELVEFYRKCASHGKLYR